MQYSNLPFALIDGALASPVNSQFPEIITLVVIRGLLNKHIRCHEAWEAKHELGSKKQW